MARLFGSVLFAGIACTACVVASCAPAAPAVVPGAPASTVTSAPAPAPVDAVDVHVEVRAPLRARYDPSVGGAQRPSLGIVVTNRSKQPVDVSNLRVHLGAVREGVAFRCAKEVGPQIGDREPSVLAPGESFVFDRDLDCALPLVGAYAVRVAVSFGRGQARSPRDVRAFTLTVAAPANVEPREIEGVPGVWASMGSSNKLTGGVGRGYGRTVLTIASSARKPIELPRMSLALRVYRAGNPIPCESEPVALAAPAVLGPGETHVEPIEVSCIGLGVPGSYDIAARLVVPRGSEGDREIALGNLHVDVVTDPTVLMPPVYR
jgi:hypothetical protein